MTNSSIQNTEPRRKIRILFLFGSGVSLPASMPGVNEITEIVESGKRIVKFYDDTYGLAPLHWKDGEEQQKGFVPRVTECISYIKTLTSKYYWPQQPKHVTNYEDYFHVSNQIESAMSEQYSNPALLPTIDHAKERLRHILSARGDESREEWNLLELFEETTKYIADVLKSLLLRDKTRIDHLKVLIDALNDREVSPVNICTLNHDLLLEYVLKESDISYNDGFESIKGNFVRWNSDRLFETGNVPYLLKLHGSIDWYRYQMIIDNRQDSIVSRYMPLDELKSLQIEGLHESPLPNHPQIIVGTYNKALEYQRDIFFDQQVRFFELLRDSDYLFISGYGFKDLAVNFRIANWMKNNSSRTLLVAHADLSSLMENATLAMDRLLFSWRIDKRLIEIPKWIEDVSWKEVKEYILGSERNDKS